ncbi:MAG TPA: CRISPR-associated protein Cas4 [Desulfobacterales bacterium]|nr:CRISPR-associated protein Cas4 [Desulfobacterales bacterium]
MFPVTLIKEYLFCPRIPYFILVLNISEISTGSMEMGKNLENREKLRAKRRKTLFRKEKVLRRWLNLKLFSERLKLFGVVDEIVETEEGLVVVEYKYGALRRKGVFYQTIAYAMLVSEHFKKRVNKIILVDLSTGKRLEIPFEERHSEHVKWIIGKLEEIVEKGKMPPRGSNCPSCLYRKFCIRE